MHIPEKYKWLSNEPGPKMILEFLKVFGVKETPGPDDNPEILAWAKEVGLEDKYVDDATPWCGLEIAVIAQRAGKEVVKDPLWALNWAKFGTKVDTPMLGDVLVFKRPQGGHVGLYVGEDKVAYHVAGGNQSDQSQIIRIEKTRLYAARRPVYKTGQPANVRVIQLSNDGKLSTNES